MVIIRQIRPTEGQELRAVRLRALADSPAAFGSTLAETEARPASYWDERARGATGPWGSALFLAEDQRRWVGLVGGFVQEDEGGRSVELISMWVDPAYRGLGIGRKLVERVVDWARERGARLVSLWVTESNHPAISLYLACGFRATGESQPLPSSSHLLEQKMLRNL